jgi:probable rRNA maturation factor
MRVKTNFQNLNGKIKVDPVRVRKAVRAILEHLDTGDVETDLIFLDDPAMRRLNREWFGHDTATDVIAWPSGEWKCGGVDEGRIVYLGNIAVSSDRAMREAGHYGNSFKEELATYVVHGILHLLGYEDTTREGRLKMKRVENGLAEKIGSIL